MKNKYDSIVIGSGAGGMTAATALARAGQKVLLCEQHGKAGGWTHSFNKKGYHYNTGVHYIGDLHPGGQLRRTYEGLGVSADLAFMELNPDAYDHIWIGEEKFDIPKGEEKYKNRLKDRFPKEKKGIDAFFNKMIAIQEVAQQMNRGNWSYVLRRISTFLWLLRPAGKLVNKYLSDPMLKGIINSQIGIHGMPPKSLSAAFLTGGIIHYFNGAYHPLGGGKAIGDAFIKRFKEAGGELRLKAKVKRILTKDKKVKGIELESGEEFFAKNIISNADPSLTFNKLVGEEVISSKLKRKINKLKYSTSSISLFLAVDMDLRKEGYDSGNYWLYKDPDMDKNYDLVYTDHAVVDVPEAMFVTITTLKDPSKRKKDHHQLEVFTLTSYDAFKKWAHLPFEQRGEEYEKLKEDITDRMLIRLEESFPGLREKIVFKELGTPLTNEHYVEAPYGNVYGIEKNVGQIGPRSFQVKTEIENLFLCGASTIGHGIAPSTHSGLVAAAAALKCKTKELLDPEAPELKIYPADDPGKWPDELLNG